MLSDQELEDVLRRYRVVDPPPQLAWSIARVATRVSPASTSAWMWGPAVAAGMLIAWFGFEFAMLTESADPIRDAEVMFVSEILGGGEGADAYAQVVVPVREEAPTDSSAEEPWQEP